MRKARLVNNAYPAREFENILPQELGGLRDCSWEVPKDFPKQEVESHGMHVPEGVINRWNTPETPLLIGREYSFTGSDLKYSYSGTWSFTELNNFLHGDDVPPIRAEGRDNIPIGYTSPRRLTVFTTSDNGHLVASGCRGFTPSETLDNRDALRSRFEGPFNEYASSSQVESRLGLEGIVDLVDRMDIRSGQNILIYEPTDPYLPLLLARNGVRVYLFSKGFEQKPEDFKKDADNDRKIMMGPMDKVAIDCIRNNFISIFNDMKRSRGVLLPSASLRESFAQLRSIGGEYGTDRLDAAIITSIDHMWEGPSEMAVSTALFNARDKGRVLVGSRYPEELESYCGVLTRPDTIPRLKLSVIDQGILLDNRGPIKGNIIQVDR